VEAQGQGPRGEILEGVKVMRGSACGPRVKPTRSERTIRVHQSLKPARLFFGMVVKRHEGQRASRGVAAIGRGNPL
jgi:hypothetical protein